MKIWILVPGLSVLLLGAGAAPTLAQPGTLPKPARVRPTEPGKQITQDLMEFVATLNSDRRYPPAQKWVYGARIGFFGAQEWAREGSWHGGIKVENIVVGPIDGENATATVTYSFAIPGGMTNLPPESRAMFERERNETLQMRVGTDPFGKERIWQIVPKPPEAAAPGTDTSAGVLGSSAFFLAQRWPVEGGNPKAKRTLSNLKQLGLGVMQFVMDYDERYAFAPEYLQEALMPYIKSKELFFVPGTLETYSFNVNLSDKGLAAINEAARTVLFYEGENEKPVFRYEGRAAICYADGHVKMVSPEEAKILIWKP